ncbi:MAG TPA: hypothetical protein VNA04_02970 [Thermoanaerobaculia bacterium]|nr:hypothetical protein [Thermoanaerobaculia bacterium]
MAKVQGKKAAAGPARRATRKVAARVKVAARSAKKKAVKRASAARPARKAAGKAAKSVARKAPRGARPARAVRPARRAAAKPKPAAVPAARPRPPVAPNVPAVPKPAAAKKTRTRRPRPRIHSNGAPVAAWLPQGEKPRPSSFIPAPARAEAPSLIAAAPASSDRLIRPEDVTAFVTRTVPIRVDFEQSGGRVYIGINPEELTLRAGEGTEWDFRYFGGADVTVDEVVIEFEKPSPFSHATFRSRKPGTARPHRQLSGPAQKSAAGKRVRYTIRAMTAFKTELGVARPFVTVVV